jgi:hypothetical protein
MLSGGRPEGACNAAETADMANIQLQKNLMVRDPMLAICEQNIGFMPFLAQRIPFCPIYTEKESILFRLALK